MTHTHFKRGGVDVEMAATPQPDGSCYVTVQAVGNSWEVAAFMKDITDDVASLDPPVTVVRKDQ